MDLDAEVDGILTPPVVEFVSSLVRKFAPKRNALLDEREVRSHSFVCRACVLFLV